MENAKLHRRLVLIIGFSLVAVTAALFAIVMVRDVNGSSLSRSIGYEPAVLFGLIIMLPVLLEELSLLRSVYKLCFFGHGRSAKICYVVSAVLACVVLLFEALLHTGVITKVFFPDGLQAANGWFVDVVIAVEWLGFLGSYGLGSCPAYGTSPGPSKTSACQ